MTKSPMSPAIRAYLARIAAGELEPSQVMESKPVALAGPHRCVDCGSGCSGAIQDVDGRRCRQCGNAYLDRRTEEARR